MMLSARFHESANVDALDRREEKLQLAEQVGAGSMLSNVVKA